MNDEYKSLERETSYNFGLDLKSKVIIIIILLLGISPVIFLIHQYYQDNNFCKDKGYSDHTYSNVPLGYLKCIRINLDTQQLEERYFKK